MSIRTRLTLWLGGILLVSLAVMGGVLHHEWVEQQQRLLEFKASESVWEEVGEIIFLYGAPSAGLLLLGSWWLLRQSLAPVISLTHAAERIHAGNLHERLPLAGSGDELDRLTEVFNSMITRLDSSFTQIREFTLHASHELKTPLTIMRGEFETRLREPGIPLPDREFFADQLDEIDRLTKIVDALTLLAKADAGQVSIAHESVQLDELVRDSFTDAQLLAKSRNISVKLESCEPTMVTGDRHRLKQLLLNLTENAIKYTETGGRIILALRHDNGHAEFSIANSGPGIDQDKLPRVFDRFYRGDPAHNSAIDGCGLGLSIAQWIVRAHNGVIEVASEPEKLTTFMVKLPSCSSERRP